VDHSTCDSNRSSSLPSAATVLVTLMRAAAQGAVGVSGLHHVLVVAAENCVGTEPPPQLHAAAPVARRAGRSGKSLKRESIFVEKNIQQRYFFNNGEAP
jgi:hypothetical protein